MYLTQLTCDLGFKIIRNQVGFLEDVCFSQGQGQGQVKHGCVTHVCSIVTVFSFKLQIYLTCMGKNNALTDKEEIIVARI